MLEFIWSETIRETDNYMLDKHQNILNLFPESYKAIFGGSADYSLSSSSH